MANAYKNHTTFALLQNLSSLSIHQSYPYSVRLETSVKMFELEVAKSIHYTSDIQHNGSDLVPQRVPLVV